MTANFVVETYTYDMLYLFVPVLIQYLKNMRSYVANWAKYE
jgi:hypothetical protein